jgi:hypothetical protein
MWAQRTGCFNLVHNWVVSSHAADREFIFKFAKLGYVGYLRKLRIEENQKIAAIRIERL